LLGGLKLVGILDVGKGVALNGLWLWLWLILEQIIKRILLIFLLDAIWLLLHAICACWLFHKVKQVKLWLLLLLLCKLLLGWVDKGPRLPTFLQIEQVRRLELFQLFLLPVDVLQLNQRFLAHLPLYLRQDVFP